jgi:hypothetical protein
MSGNDIDWASAESFARLEETAFFFIVVETALVETAFE